MPMKKFSVLGLHLFLYRENFRKNFRKVHGHLETSGGRRPGEGSRALGVPERSGDRKLAVTNPQH